MVLIVLLDDVLTRLTKLYLTKLYLMLHGCFDRDCMLMPASRFSYIHYRERGHCMQTLPKGLDAKCLAFEEQRVIFAGMLGLVKVR